MEERTRAVLSRASAAGVYRRVKALARSALERERAGHLLQTTALAHEALLRLARVDLATRDDEQVLHLVARAIRRTLVDEARKRLASKRTLAPSAPSEAQESAQAAEADAEELLDLHQALRELACRDPRQARVVELRYFAGLSIDETAAALGVAARTVDTDWSMARAWLRRRLAVAAPP